MRRSSLTGQRLLAIFLVGFALFNYPIMSLFDHSGSVFGIPGTVAYLFFAWAALIALMAWVTERRSET